MDIDLSCMNLCFPYSNVVGNRYIPWWLILNILYEGKWSNHSWRWRFRSSTNEGIRSCTESTSGKYFVGFLLYCTRYLLLQFWGNALKLEFLCYSKPNTDMAFSSFCYSKQYSVPKPPRPILNVLESLGYTVISSTGIGQTIVWTLHKPNFSI